MNMRFSRAVSTAMRSLMIGAGLAAVSAVGVQAGVVYTTFGPGGTYSNTDGYGVDGASSSFAYHDFASPFTLSTNATVTGFDLALFNNESGDAGATVRIITNPSNNNGTTSGNIIASADVSAPAGYPGLDVMPGTTMSGTFGSAVSLTAGVVYYLLIKPTSPDTFDTWYQSLTKTAFDNYQNGNDFSVTTPVGAFDLIGTAETRATPLPGTLPLFVSGLSGLGLLGWRRRRMHKA